MGYCPASYRYDKSNRVHVKVAFNRKTEPELVERIQGEENRSGFIKRLIRDEMERESSQENK